MSRSSVASRLSSAASKFARVAELPFLAATRDALPWSFIGLLAAFALLLPFVREPGPFFSSTFGLRISGALLPAFGVMGLVLAPSIGWQYARRVDRAPWLLALGAALAYLGALPPPGGGDVLAYLHAVGPSGLFLALIASGVLAFLVRVLGRAWLACALVVLLALATHPLHISVPDAIARALVPLGHLGDSYPALILIVLVETLLWSCGLHGPALLAAVVTPVYFTLQMQNLDAYRHHLPLPHIVVVSLFLFVFPGGAGATLPLAALLALSRIKRLRAIGRVALVPALFNTNEPLLFGAPVVFNPYLVPPFVIVPLLLATTTYCAVAFGWVARAAYYIPGVVPSVVATVAATLDWRAVVLVVANIAIASICYLPFVRAYERHLEADAQVPPREALGDAACESGRV
ncbi:MAG: PTS sugar transporter subunit IIC [bacterium]|nr:PTS sugar transporter subunit IIC [bacterium]